MSCRLIKSPITGEEVRSQTWDDIRNLVGTDQEADRLYKQLLSPSFLQWFGDWVNDPHGDNTSKIVNEYGEPKLVYHASETQFTEFDLSATRLNGSKTSTEGFHFTGTLENIGYYQRRGYGQEIYSTFLNLKKPTIDNNYNRNIEYLQKRFFSENDGAIMYQDDPDVTEYVAFQSNQIKSLFNQGDFSSKRNSIYEYRDNEIKQKLNTSINRQLFNRFYKNDPDKFFDKLGDQLSKRELNNLRLSTGNTLEELLNNYRERPMDVNNISGYNYQDLPEVSLYTNVLGHLQQDKKSAFVRATRFPSGVYIYQNEYYKVQQRPGKQLLKDLKDSASFEKDFISREEKQSSLIQNFLNNSQEAYIYDIEKVEYNPDHKIKGTIRESRIQSRNFYKTWDYTFDKFIQSFYEKRKTLVDQLSKTKDPERQRALTKELSAIEKDIKGIATSATESTLIKTGHAQLYKLSNQAGNLSNTPENIRTILEGIRTATVWKEIDQLFDLTREYTDEEDIQFVSQAKAIRSRATDLHTQYHEKLLSTIKGEVSTKLGTEQAKKAFEPIKDIGMLEKQFLGISFSDNPLEQIVDYIIRENIYNINKEYEDFEHKVNETFKGEKDLSFLMEDVSDGKGFITMYDRKFIEESAGKYQQAQDGDLSWNNYYTWFRDNYNYELTQEGKESWESFAEALKDEYVRRDEHGEPLYDENTGELLYNMTAYNKEIKRLSPYEFQKFLDGSTKKANKGVRWFNIAPKDEHLNSNYTKLTSKQKSLYDAYVNEFVKAQKNIPIDYRFGNFEIDKLLYDLTVGQTKEGLERIKDVGNKVSSFFTELVTVNYKENEYSTQNTSALTGELEERIRFKNVKQFMGDATNPDLLEVLKGFKKFSLSYKMKTQSEDVLVSIRDIAKTLDKVETTSDGRVKHNQFRDLISSKSKSNVADRLEYNIESYLYDKRKNPLGAINADPVIGENNLSVEKMIETVNNYTRIRQLALAPLSAISNLMMGSMNNFIYASRNEQFSDGELLKGYSKMKGSIARFYSSSGGVFGKGIGNNDAEKAARLMGRFNILGDVTESQYFNSQMESFVDKLFFMQKGGEFLNQGAVMTAMMLREKVNGKSLWDLINLDKENNLVFDPSLDDKYLLDFFNKVGKVNKQIHGDYDGLNPMYAKKSLLGRVFLLFRTWLPQSAYQRLGKEKEDYMLGKTKGRWRSYEYLYKDRNGSYNFQNLGKFLLKAAVPLVTKDVKFDGVEDVDQRNLLMNVRELQFIAAITMATLLLKGMIEGDDDDEPQKQSYLYYLYNQTNRFQNELTFFYSFSSFNQFVRDVLPVENTLRQFGKTTDAALTAISSPEDDIYQQGFRKGNSKFWTQMRMLVPLTKQGESVFSVFNNMYKDNIR